MPFPDYEMFKHDEGLRLKAYKDTEGWWTIGYGHFLGQTPIPQEITMEQAMTLLMGDVNHAIINAKSFSWFYTLSENRKNVIVNMLFNLGMSRFSGFKKMIALVDSRQYKEAAIEMMDSKWAEQVKARAARLAYMMQLDVNFQKALELFPNK
jgi:lysozyme